MPKKIFDASHSMWLVWVGMMDRCTNPNSPGYSNYGGRGIKICSAWREAFSNFVRDMPPRPSRDYQLDRIDSDKGYHPSNVRWVTKLQNARNKRNTIRVQFEGKTVSLADAAETVGIPLHTAYCRYKKGWPMEKVLEKDPTKFKGRTKDIAGGKFGKLTVVEQVEGPRVEVAYWRCLCDCGRETIVSGHSLRTGNTRSCGCLKGRPGKVSHGHSKSEYHLYPKAAIDARRSHGLSKTPTYVSWAVMKRKIPYTNRWESFDSFLADMGEKPEGTSLRRKDRSLPCSLQNCMWV